MVTRKISDEVRMVESRPRTEYDFVCVEKYLTRHSVVVSLKVTCFPATVTGMSLHEICAGVALLSTPVIVTVAAVLSKANCSCFTSQLLLWVSSTLRTYRTLQSKTKCKNKTTRLETRSYGACRRLTKPLHCPRHSRTFCLPPAALEAEAAVAVVAVVVVDEAVDEAPA